MPTVLKLLGMRFYYWSIEYEPIHVHVCKGDAKEIIRDNREYMIEHWTLFFKR